MNRAEFNQFTRALFVAFPGLNQFLSEACVRDAQGNPDCKATLEVWFRTLTPITYTEAMDVLAGWIDGKLQPLKAYERENVALVVRAIVLAERDKRKRRSSANAIGDEYVKVSRSQYRSIASDNADLAAIFEQVKPLNEKLKAGEIDADERKRQILKITAKL